MKTTKIILSSLFVLAIISTTIFIGCKKKKEDTPVAATCSDKIKNQGETDIDCGGPCTACIVDDTEEQKQNSEDESDVSSETDAAIDDANNSASANRMAGKTEGINSWKTPCDATIDSTTDIKNLKITITYDGTSCNGKRKRTGTVTIQLADETHIKKSWGNKGATLTITYNLTITKISTGKKFTISGTNVITNTTGGILKNLSTTPITHKVTGNAEITFDGSTAVRTWNLTKTVTYANVDTDVQITNTGDAANNGILITGKNRKGEDYSVTIPTANPIVFSRNTCPTFTYNNVEYPKWTVIKGIKNHKNGTKELTTTFGVDKDGKVVTSGCPYGYKLDWTNAKGVAKTLTLAYL